MRPNRGRIDLTILRNKSTSHKTPLNIRARTRLSTRIETERKIEHSEIINISSKLLSELSSKRLGVFDVSNSNLVPNVLGNLVIGKPESGYKENQNKLFHRSKIFSERRPETSLKICHDKHESNQSVFKMLKSALGRPQTSAEECFWSQPKVRKTMIDLTLVRKIENSRLPINFVKSNLEKQIQNELASLGVLNDKMMCVGQAKTIQSSNKDSDYEHRLSVSSVQKNKFKYFNMQLRPKCVQNKISKTANLDLVDVKVHDRKFKRKTRDPSASREKTS
mmetsp:Transcript_17426/g.20247  ORF Transcript_17426/g.20247 Transcript_17426/m.20247 type:complete len:278 (-) Transcript_17426:32-865(-)